MVLKAELHCHIEGAAHPSLVKRLAQKYDTDVSAAIDGEIYKWHDFTSFIKAYDMASSVFRDPLDYHLLAYDHFSRLAEQNCIYGEVFISSDHAAQQGIAYNDLVDGIAQGINDAKKDHGIEGRMIATGVRHLGVEAVIEAATIAADNPHPMVTGFGMAGDERVFNTRDFTEAFEIAREAGLELTCHAGELTGAQTVSDTVEFFGVSRIGHGVRAIESPELVRDLAREGIVLEVCPCSNIALEVFDNFKNHPLSNLIDARIPVTLNSDDPPFFETTIANEYDVAVNKLGCNEDDLLLITQTAIEAAFVDEHTRSKLIKKLKL
jgi:adenosine deaminase